MTVTGPHRPLITSALPANQFVQWRCVKLCLHVVNISGWNSLWYLSFVSGLNCCPEFCVSPQASSDCCIVRGGRYCLWPARPAVAGIRCHNSWLQLQNKCHTAVRWLVCSRKGIFCSRKGAHFVAAKAHFVATAGEHSAERGLSWGSSAATTVRFAAKV